MFLILHKLYYSHYSSCQLSSYINLTWFCVSEKTFNLYRFQVLWSQGSFIFLRRSKVLHKQSWICLSFIYQHHIKNRGEIVERFIYKFIKIPYNVSVQVAEIIYLWNTEMMMEFLSIFHTLVMSGFIDISSGFIFVSIYSVAIAHIALPLQNFHVSMCTSEHTRTNRVFCKFSGLLLLPFRNFTGILGPLEHTLRTIVVDSKPRKIRTAFFWKNDRICFSGGHWHTCLYLLGVMIMVTSIAHTFVQLKDKRQKQLPGWMEKLRVIHFQFSKLLSPVTLGSSCCTGVYTCHLPVSSASIMFYFRQPHQAIL